MQRSVTFGALLHELRTKRQESLREVAERVPMTDSNLSRIERGKQGPPSDETIKRLAVALDADPGELLRAAGRIAGESDFEQFVRTQLNQLRSEVGTISAEIGEIARDIGEIKSVLGGSSSQER
ncbi:MAG TPA: helix-turn-helix transcriptional regulator [Solirubrobacterales bacterium]|nr:helix-turn-helix transcriptional regulator [Solirubrobacterales bacterium]